MYNISGSLAGIELTKSHPGCDKVAKGLIFVELS
jgi:hypothetical protein